jgi:ketosteroid isomerase-like protein
VELPKYNLFSILVFSRRDKQKQPAHRLDRFREVTLKFLARLSLLTILILLAPATPRGHAQTRKTAHSSAGFREQDMLNAIRKLEDEMRIALLKGDAGWWSAYLSDEYSETEPDGKILSKAQAVERQRSKTLVYDTLNLSDRTVHTYNGDTVILTGKVTVEGTDQGQSMSGVFQFTRVWVKQGLEWKLASYQMTRVAS